MLWINFFEPLEYVAISFEVNSTFHHLVHISFFKSHVIREIDKLDFYDTLNKKYQECQECSLNIKGEPLVNRIMNWIMTSCPSFSKSWPSIRNLKRHLPLERFSIECRIPKPTYYSDRSGRIKIAKRRWRGTFSTSLEQRNQTIKIKTKDTSLAPDRGKWMRAGHDWVCQFYFHWLKKWPKWCHLITECSKAKLKQTRNYFRHSIELKLL